MATLVVSSRFCPLIDKSLQNGLLRACCRPQNVCLRDTVSRSRHRWSSWSVKSSARFSRLWVTGLVGGVASAVTLSSAWLFTNWSPRSLLFGPREDSAVVHAAEVWKEEDEPSSVSPRRKWNFIADVVDKAAPAVVYIEIQGRHPFTGQLTAISNGSGFIVREDGIILTNAHVVANKTNVKVRMNNGKTFTGYVQAVDPVSDLATVKVDAKGLPTLKLGDSSDLRPGEWVVALGSPFQLSNTVTAGIVSTPCRGSAELGLHNKDMEYVQTDAVINFGNSGGPLVNLDGEAIGINTMKVTTGISFAIPSDYAKGFLEKAKYIENRSDQAKRWFSNKPERPNRRYLGVTMLTLTPPLIAEIKARQEFPNVDHGVLIHRVIIGSPAYNGGIRAGDIILKINDKDIKAATDVYKAVESENDLHLVIQRGSELISLIIRPEDVH